MFLANYIDKAKFLTERGWIFNRQNAGFQWLCPVTHKRYSLTEALRYQIGTEKGEIETIVCSGCKNKFYFTTPAMNNRPSRLLCFSCKQRKSRPSNPNKRCTKNKSLLNGVVLDTDRAIFMELKEKWGLTTSEMFGELIECFTKKWNDEDE